MSDNESSGEKTEDATTQRREEFRRTGQVAQSKEIATVLILMGVAVLCYFLSREFLIEISKIFSSAFTDQIVNAARQGEMLAALRYGFLHSAMIIGPIFGVALLLAVGSTVSQIGFITAWENLEPDLNRINPISGFQKIFNLRGLIEGAKSIIKIIIVSTVVFMIIKKEMAFTPQLVQLSTTQIFAYIGHVLFRLVGGVCALMAVLAVLDFAYQKWDLERRMRMTKQEVKEEFKQREGDPMIKSRIRRIQRELSQKRMMDKIPKADVIVTNPTHIAVALQYDRVTMAAPVMIAKGADLIAERIKKIAREHNIPVVENVPLARALFKTLKINQPIPKNLYNAVAEILAYVYRIKGRIQQMHQELTRDQEARGTPGGGPLNG
jgi:flagellar biosynthetic protein FlhB